jgi:hypothetical protein
MSRRLRIGHLPSAGSTFIAGSCQQRDGDDAGDGMLEEIREEEEDRIEEMRTGTKAAD